MLIAGGLAILTFIISFYHRYIYIDDAWFGEQAYWLAKTGIVKSVSIKNFFGWDSHLLVYHKLHIIIGAALIKLFGWSVTPLRGFSFLILILFVIMLSQYFIKRKVIFSNGELIIALFFLAINPLIALYGFTYRPEILVMALGFASFAALDSYITKSKKTSLPILAGLLAGLAFYTHLNGMIFGMAGVVLLLWYRMFRQVFVFGFFTFVTASFYFYELLNPENLNVFFYQMANWPDPVGTQYFDNSVGGFLTAVLKKLSDEHMRFFWSYKVWGFSALFIFLILLNFSFLRKNHKHLLVYLFSLILCLNIFGSQIAERFLLLFMPYMLIIISIGITRIKLKSRLFGKSVVLLFLILNLTGLALIFDDIFSRNNDFLTLHEKVMANIPDEETNILVSYPFVFNALENRNLITYKTFEYNQVRFKKEYSQMEFLSKADSLNIGYIIVPPDMISEDDNRFPFLCDGLIDDNPLYELWDKESDHLILKRK